MSFHTNLQMADALGALTVAPQSAVLHYARMGVIRKVGGFPVMPVGEIALIHLATMAGLPALRRFRDAVEAAAHASLMRGYRGAACIRVIEKSTRCAVRLTST